jgi:hypothetical protein
VLHDDFGDLSAARRSQDQKIIAFVRALSEERFAERLDYARPAERRSLNLSIRCWLIGSITRRTIEVRRITC